MKNEERIYKFLTGAMSPAEENEFLDDIKSDDNLREQAILHANMCKGMVEVDRELVNTLKQCSQKEIKQLSRPLKPNRLLRWGTIAASIALCVLSGYAWVEYHSATISEPAPQPAPKPLTLVELGRKYATMNVGWDMVEKQGCVNPDVLYRIKYYFDNIKNGVNLKETTLLLEIEWKRAKSTERTKRAKSTENQEYASCVPYVGWYLAIGYMQQNDAFNAIIVLETLRRDYPTNTILDDRIDELIQQLYQFDIKEFRH